MTPDEKRPDEKRKNTARPFQEGKAGEKNKPKLKEVSVEERLAQLEAEVAGRSELVSAPLPLDLPEPSGKSQPLAKAKKTKSSASTSGVKVPAPHVNMAAFWLIAVLSIVLANAPGVNLLLTPVSQFVTMIHECSHAIVALLTGGHPSVTIVPDGLGHGGLTQMNGGWLFLSAQAGYLGTALFGCLLIYLGQFPKYSRYILMTIGSMMIFSSIIFITPSIFNFTTVLSGIFSMMWGLIMGIGCIYMGKKLSPLMANLVLLFLAVQTALNSVTLAWVLVPHALGMAGTGFSDATVMAANYFLPAVFWAFLWIALSLIMLFFTLKFTYGKAILNRKNTGKNI